MIIDIKSCEKAHFLSSQQTQNAPKEPRIREPIDYSKVNLNELKRYEEDRFMDLDFQESNEEKVIVDLSDTQPNKVVSMADILLGGNKNEEKR